VSQLRVRELIVPLICKHNTIAKKPTIII